MMLCFSTFSSFGSPVDVNVLGMHIPSKLLQPKLFSFVFSWWLTIAYRENDAKCGFLYRMPTWGKENVYIWNLHSHSHLKVPVNLFKSSYNFMPPRCEIRLLFCLAWRMGYSLLNYRLVVSFMFPCRFTSLCTCRSQGTPFYIPTSS